ncbi:MAG: DUF6481 family protein [Phenylobacterium sp.]
MSKKDLKGSGLTDRLSAAADAKAALLAKLKPKPTVTDPQFEERVALRDAARKAELDAVRTARADEKEAARQAAEDARAADAATIQAAEDAVLAEKRGVRKERKQLSKAEAQAKRDARYAARNAR